MEFVQKFLGNSLVIRNLVTLVAVIACFGLSYLFNSRYNDGGSKGFLWAARVTVVIGCILVITWFF